MAYDSDESGRIGVCAQSYPSPRVRRWTVSPANGSEPMWTRGGRELVYRKGDSVMAGGGDLGKGRRGTPQAPFAGPGPDKPRGDPPRSLDGLRRGGRVFGVKPAPRERPPA